jgi:hypothetical protein
MGTDSLTLQQENATKVVLVNDRCVMLLATLA